MTRTTTRRTGHDTGDNLERSPRRNHTDHSADLRFAAALRSELIKFRTLRVLVWLTVAGAVAHAALGPIQILGLVVEGNDVDLVSLDMAMSLALTGMSTACILFGIAGVLTVTSEFPTRAIRTTLTAVPRRGLVVSAKLAAYGIVAGTAALIATIVALVASIPGLTAVGYSVDPARVDVVRVVAAAALYLLAWGFYGQLFGWLVRSAVGATMALLAFFFAMTVLTELLPQRVADVVQPLMPAQAASAMLATSPTPGVVSPLLGLVLSAVYVLLGSVAVVGRLARRDS